ncbi:hypothetical protein BUALT_Bualt18G0040800 [Buddleja alternifolia]|uniref:Uncharacterized protein n=1 Tax=Buddleja alternifolia TaxID=168488 RepID=A0AAV6W3E4_9LAMI|nr:hypothetical protein BUALT_Bualt18G0040800 [Buddleja alternifolia]
MILLKTILTRHLHRILKPQNPSNYPQNPHFLTSLIYSNSCQFSSPSSFSSKPFSLSAHFLENPKEKRPLSALFKETVRPSQKIKYISKVKAQNDSANAKLKKKVKNLTEVKGENVKLFSEKGVKKNLYEMFTYKNVNKEVKLVEPFECANEGSIVHEKLSSDMQMFANHLYNEGYLKNASFMPKDKFDLTRFEAIDAREFLKFAAVKFGRDHQKIARWLSTSDLKKVALFGCPSLIQRSVYAAKNLRRIFQIEEHQVCRLCTLKNSCKHENKMLKSKKSAIKLRMDDVTRVLVTYAMEVEPRLVVIPEEIKNCVSRSLKQVIILSQTVS